MTEGELVARGDQLRTFQPSNPVEMEGFIRSLGDVIEDLPDVITDLLEARYAAERALRKKRQQRYLDHCKTMPSMRARAQSDLDAEAEYEAHDRARAAWHHADTLLKALTTKLNALLNVNKGITAAYMSYGSRQ
ncbi:hypothetical protein MN032_10865 [Agromyces atrinae]|uniref:hypothetical protein n=1 Tax=Agromyces atrinae TaxID=592376 RepID=UPI001F57B726|nr:hypothetical protein [Agromyces atrinae]MCI2958198.1 hypothetical protein [Agromyces atrinae]